MKWTKLLWMAIVSFLAMYAVMYAMVDKYENIYLNINQFYMVLMMTAVMMLIEIFFMRSMYSLKTQTTTVVLSVFLLVFSFAGIRYQFFVSDIKFLKSMIPHHASALLMCDNSKIKDIEIKNLCNSIISGQQAEIDWMKIKLEDWGYKN